MIKPAEKPEEGKTPPGKKKRTLILLLCILALLFLVSTVISGILLGNRTGEQKKIHSDSFVIGEEETGGRLHLAGRITMADGRPFANGSLELHSEVRRGKTDSGGWFLFGEVERGSHSLFVLDQDGKTLAEIKVELTDHEDGMYGQLNIEKTAANQYRFLMAPEVRYLEMDLELDRGTLTVRMDKTVAVDQEGLVSLPGRMMDAKDGLVVLPSGTVITRENQILHGVIMILPDNQIVRVAEDGMILEDGTGIAGDGTITLPDGTLITLEGVRYPDTEETVRPEYPLQLTEPAAEKEPAGPGPNGQASSGETESSGGERASTEADENQGTAQTNPAGSTAAGEEPVRGPDKVESDDPSETLAPDYGDLGVYYEENGSWSVWKDAREIRLFDYMPGQSSTASIAEPLIQPGSTGYYPFEVTNTFSSHTVKIRVTVTEETIHLPLRFRLVTVNGGQKTAVSDWSSPLAGARTGVVVANANASPPGSTVRYHLEWMWPYEGGRDAMDTAAAAPTSEQNRNYTLKLEINARR